MSFLSTFPFYWVYPCQCRYLSLYSSLWFCRVFCSFRSSSLFRCLLPLSSLTLAFPLVCRERKRSMVTASICRFLASSVLEVDRKCLYFLPTPNGVYHLTHTSHPPSLSIPPSLPLQLKNDTHSSSCWNFHSLSLIQPWSLLLIDYCIESLPSCTSFLPGKYTYTHIMIPSLMYMSM